MPLKKIVVIDELASVRELVGMILESEGHIVYKANNGDGPFDLFDGREIDLVIADFNMPGMDGIEVTREIRSINQYKSVPIILLTTELQAAIKEEARRADATRWIVKPFAANRLLAVVNQVLEPDQVGNKLTTQLLF